MQQLASSSTIDVLSACCWISAGAAPNTSSPPGRSTAPQVQQHNWLTHRRAWKHAKNFIYLLFKRQVLQLPQRCQYTFFILLHFRGSISKQKCLQQIPKNIIKLDGRRFVFLETLMLRIKNMKPFIHHRWIKKLSS